MVLECCPYGKGRTEDGPIKRDSSMRGSSVCSLYIMSIEYDASVQCVLDAIQR